jgi:hypothetical protein
MPSALPDRPRQLPLVDCGAGTPSCEKSVGTDGLPNQCRMSALCDVKAKFHPIAPGNNQTFPEIVSDPLPTVSTLHRSRKIVDHDPRHPLILQNPLPDNAYASTGWFEGNGLKSHLPHNCSSPLRAATTHEGDGRTGTPKIWRSPAVKRLSLSRHHQNVIFSWPPPFEAAMVSQKFSMRNYLCRFV